MTSRNRTEESQIHLPFYQRLILTSSAATEYSFERQGEDLAVYTRYLVAGIQTGAADLDGDGAISVNELHDYVREQVRKAAPAMKPERYVFQEGEKILLASARIGDPKQEFRKLVQTYSQDGLIRPAGQSMLERRRKALQLTPEEAQVIIAEVLRPYEEHREHLQEYERVLQAEMALEFPLSDRALQELQALQRELNLTDDNIAPLLQRLTPPSTSPPTVRPFGLSSGRKLSAHIEAHPLTPPPSPSSSPPSSSPPLPSPPSLLSSFSFTTPTLNDRGQETQRQPGQAEYFTADLGNGITLEMVKIPGGRFLRGTADSERQKVIQEYVKTGVSELNAKREVGRQTPQHEVILQPFFMGKYPVTQAQYEVIMGTNPAHFKGAQRPVEQVSWDEAVEFCDRLSQTTGTPYRLPSEAEWEYACRSGTNTPFYFGDTITPDLVNYDGNYPYGNAPKGTYRKETTEVGSFPANAFGLFDVHGNVWEWCADPWHDSYDRAPKDGRVWELDSDRDNNLRLLRGGSWDLGPRICRSAYRDWLRRDDRSGSIGFRVVCVVPGTL